MAKKKLGAAAKAPARITPVDLAEQDAGKQVQPHQGGVQRTTERISVSLTEQERDTLEDRSDGLRSRRGLGRRDLKVSKLARVAFRMLEDASDAEIVAIADRIEDLEARRGTRRE